MTRALVADRIIELLQREGAEHVVGFPENRLLNSAALAGMRPIVARTERVAVNIADGFARATNGERILPCVTQYGPGAEAAFAAVAQAYGDRSRSCCSRASTTWPPKRIRRCAASSRTGRSPGTSRP